MFKWLSFTIIVLTGFLIVLLSLGYLLKENEVATTALKNKLDEKALIQQRKKQAKQPQYIQDRNKQKYLKKYLSAIQKSQQKIIAEHLSCSQAEQCIVVDTHSNALGCSVAINTLGAVILMKVAADASMQSKQMDDLQRDNCLSKSQIQIAMCENNLCILK